jgi:hypothetical protein
VQRRRQNIRHGRAAGIVVAGLVAALMSSASVFAADPVTVDFAATGGEQTWNVPAGVTSIHVVLIGGRGGDSFTGNGFGHVVTGDLAVVAGTTLFVEVGGNGANSIGLPGAAGGFNGGAAGGSGTGNAGAGGGGASDIRTVSRGDTGTLASRIVVAGGGGGRGGASTGGGGGGSAGSPGATGPATFGIPGGGGGAGTTSAGGAGGSAGGPGDAPGVAGAQGLGGTGGTQSTGTVGNNGGAGGGGGGGYYGGGGGGAGAGGGGGGGGGGSSYTGTATGAFISPDSAGVPSITITYEVGPGPDPTPGGDTGVVDASIAMADASICIELSTASVDFGTGEFGQEDVAGSPDIEVTNCGQSSVTLFAKGTDATATGATWDLVKNGATCADTLGTDSYHLRLHEGQTPDVDWVLGTTNTELEDIDGGSIGFFEPSIDTACPGSSGAGLEMQMQIVFTATDPI